MLSDKQMGALVGVKIKVKPSRGTGKNGLTVAMLKRFDQKWAWIVPASHKRQERVPRENVVFWEKGLGLNPAKYDQVINLFKKIEKPVVIKGHKTEYVIVCKAFQLFWCGDHFSHSIGEAATYDNLRGPRVALAILGNARKNDKRPRWEHVLSGGTFEILPTNEVLKLAQKWKAADRKATFYNPEALSDPYYLYNQKPDEKELDTVVVEDLVEAREEPLKITEATPSPKVEAPVEKSHSELLERYANARRQIVEAQALLSEAEQEMRAVEAEFDILKKEKEFA